MGSVESGDGGIAMSQIKVLQVSKLYAPFVGGIEKVVQDIAEGLKEKVEMEVLVCQPRGQGGKEVVNGVPVTKASSLGIYWGMPVSFTFPFLLAQKSRRVDILHFHLPFPLAVVSFLLFGSKRPKVVVTYHSDIVRQKKLMWLYKPFLHRFLKRADRILVTSPNLLESSKHLDPYKDKCVVIPLWIDLKEFGQLIEKEFELGISPDEKKILFVGRLSYYKGLDYLIEAMQEVDAKLLIAGEGELRGKLEQKVKSLGVDRKVIFLGKVSDEQLKYCYQICDLFVLPSVEPSEAFGLVQLEAMAYGKPVVNTALPTGVPFVSRHGETGLTVPPRDPKALAEAINKILNDKELAKKFSENARKRAQEFSREKMLKRIYEIYCDLMEKR
jgi:rhamnosyl/mannosyltransferase